jgi:competence protein ComEA
MRRGPIFRGPVGLTPAEHRIAAGLAIVVLLGAGYAAVDRLSRPAPHVEYELRTLPVAAADETPGPLSSGVDRSGQPGTSRTSWVYGRLDLNAADYADLLRLPGIGPVLAERIVEYRDRHGPFYAVDSLINVTGIGPAKLDKLRESVCVREAGE